MGNLLVGMLLIAGTVALCWRSFAPYSDSKKLHSKLTRFHRERKNIPMAERQTELRVRTAMVRVRRLASDAVVQRPHDQKAIITNILKDEVKSLAMFDRNAAEYLQKWGAEADVGEILYSKALEAVYRDSCAKSAPRIGEQEAVDMIAALSQKS